MTNFMLYTGPLMVLAVVGMVWAGRALYLRPQKRPRQSLKEDTPIRILS